MHKVDIQDMPFEDNTYDLIWCSHVLEHVPDDRRALSEIRRILAPNGIAVIQVPLWGSKTIEGDLPTSERVRVYYQEDHLRRYGTDILERLSMDGLSVSVRNVQALELQLVLKCSLNDMASNDVFLLRKLS
jgi:SAM-dependent methyltransferase